MQIALYPSKAGKDLRWYKYQNTSLSKLRSALPIKELAALLPQRKNLKGAKPWFNNEGKIALQFLKHYEGCSDRRLLERINTDYALQFFCGISLGINEEIKDKDLIWKTRSMVAAHLDIEKFQELFIIKWKSYMTDTQTGMSDASCYESYIKYPTDEKLLWDSAEYVHRIIKYLCKEMRIKRPRNKIKDQRKKQLGFSKRKRKTHKLRRRRKRALLYLLNKLLEQLDEILVEIGQKERLITRLLDQSQLDKLLTIGKIYEQQRMMFENPGEYPKDRIVSLYKSYLHPIVRGKENKRVEFGAKVNTWQVDGLNFIEHFSFSAFHEGNRLKNGITFHQKNFGSLRRLAADAIYATNENRSFCSRFNISTNFKPKGRRKADPIIRKQRSQMRSLLGKLRATVLEGTYGNDKNHYGLRKIKARNEKTERLWIFFAMMTANAVKVAKRIHAPAKAPPLIKAA